MIIASNGHEHEFEPQYGLPERLPAGERILWQGAPDVRAVMLRVFHVRKAAIYFAVLMALRAATQMAEGTGASEALAGLAWPAGLSLLGLAGLATLAWLSARSAVYTVTDRRIVMRIGIVLTLTFNLPLRMIASAGLRRGDGGAGDIVLVLAGTDRIAWLQLWPHVRPWHLARPEPMLRAVPEAERVAALLAEAWSVVHGVAVRAPLPSAALPATAEAPALHWQPSPT
jgi:hypothetical protein